MGFGGDQGRTSVRPTHGEFAVSAQSAGGDGFGIEDPAYPTLTPPDPTYPCQTTVPIGPPLDGVAVPALWSRLQRPLERALIELWQACGLPPETMVADPVSLYYGRITVNAHAWERLRALLHDQEPDPALVAPEPGGLRRWLSRWNLYRARKRVEALPGLCRDLERQGEATIRKLSEIDTGHLDPLELARGPLHEGLWSDLLVPWLAARALGEPGGLAQSLVRAAVKLEERYAGELGRRLCGQESIGSSDSIAFLTVSERLRLVHETSRLWNELVEDRRRRVETFISIDFPSEFWGRPRVEMSKSR